MSFLVNLNLQDSNSIIMENLILFHDHAMIIIMMILVLILYIIIFMLSNKMINRFMFEGQLIEIIWTLIPVLLLLFLIFPSLKILYLSDEIYNPLFSLKILGRQWYWTYEYNNFENIKFDSFILNYQEMNNFNFRLLDVDNHLILPMNLNIRLLISSLDVIHSFTVPSMGVKIDAIPGRINQIMINLNRPGLYYGQCSEICGLNHSFMPIVVESINMNNFLWWINNYN